MLQKVRSFNLKMFKKTKGKLIKTLNTAVMRIAVLSVFLFLIVVKSLNENSIKSSGDIRSDHFFATSPLYVKQTSFSGTLCVFMISYYQ